MRIYDKFYINGEWVAPVVARLQEVSNPATEQVCAQISLGSAADVDKAARAARNAFKTFSRTSRQDRIDLLAAICAGYQKRYHDIADAICEEMGAPTKLAVESQAAIGIGHLSTALDVLKRYEFEQTAGDSLIFKEPIGVCGLITPWNWPINQITCKVAPAIAVGCTVILKPSEVAPLSAYIFSEIMHDAGVPAGVYNLINGDGLGVGTALSTHPEIDMMSFTGSTRAGALVAQNSAPTVKRVTQELGGKSANIILPDADLEAAVSRGVLHMYSNSGQSCNAPSRMLVPAALMTAVEEIAAKVTASVVVGDPKAETTTMGPVVSEQQFNKIQGLIQRGIDEGARLVAGGVGRPEGLDHGYYVKPTVFSNVSNSMTIAKEEIFGPVLVIIPYQTLEQAIDIANDSPYGLAGYIQGNDIAQIKQVAAQIRAGNINVNGKSGDMNTPFGGFKQSGNGREWGEHGFADYLEIKAVSGVS